MTAIAHSHGPGRAPGAPLVLLHAFPLDSRMWDGVIAALPEEHILAVDQPGFGAAAAAAEPERTTIESLAEAVRTALTEAGVHRAVIAGVSMGGYVAMALADRYPEMIAGLGLLSTKAGADDEQARRNRLEVARRALEDSGADVVLPMAQKLLSPTTLHSRPEVEAQVRTWLSQARPEAIAGAQRAMAARPDRHHVLAGLDVPALVAHGSQDALASAADHEQMAAQLGVDLTTFDGAGHLSALETPLEVAAVLAGLMQQVAR